MGLNVTPDLQRYIDLAQNARGTRESARQAMNCLDLTSLNGDETKNDIHELCDIAKHNYLASVCIYPEHVATAAKALKGTGVTVATVVNYPTGVMRTLKDEAATPLTTAEDVKSAIRDGAGQVDLVIPYAQFNKGNSFQTHSFLQAARQICPPEAMFKVILETAAFQNEDVLRHACRVAIQRGANCLKSSTGKHPYGGVTMATAAILLDEAFHASEKVGVKLTGGIRSNDECAKYMTLARAVMGWNAIRPDVFRIGASSLLEDLIRSLGSQPMPTRTPSAA